MEVLPAPDGAVMMMSLFFTENMCKDGKETNRQQVAHHSIKSIQIVAISYCVFSALKFWLLNGGLSGIFTILNPKPDSLWQLLQLLVKRMKLFLN